MNLGSSGQDVHELYDTPGYLIDGYDNSFELIEGRPPGEPGNGVYEPDPAEYFTEREQYYQVLSQTYLTTGTAFELAAIVFIEAPPLAAALGIGGLLNFGASGFFAAVADYWHGQLHAEQQDGLH